MIEFGTDKCDGCLSFALWFKTKHATFSPCTMVLAFKLSFIVPRYMNDVNASHNKELVIALDSSRVVPSLSSHRHGFERQHMPIRRSLPPHTRIVAKDRELNPRVISHRHLSAEERRPIHTCKIQIDRMSQDRCEGRGFRHIRSDHVDCDVTIGIVPFPRYLESNVGASTECERGVDFLRYAELEFRDRSSALFVIELC